jgi:type I restriction enzyme, S subunit
MNSFPRYDSYENSGVDWLEQIPQLWEIQRLGHLGRFSASGIDKHYISNESEVRIINFTDVYDNPSMTLNSSSELMVVTTPEPNRIKNLVRKGDLIFLPSSETYEDLGRSVLINENLENTAFSYHVIRLNFGKEIEHDFKKYLTNNNFVLNQFSKEGKGTTRKIIGRNVFRNVLVIIPPRRTQIGIAKFLDLRMDQISQGIVQKEKQIELLKERRQILIHKAVTRGLDPNIKLKNSGVDWIGQIPQHWKAFPIFGLFEVRDEPGNESLPMLSVSIHTAVSSEQISDEENIRGKVRTEDKSSYKSVLPGDIAFNMMRAWQGAIGAVQTAGMVSPAYIVAKPKTDIFSKYFEHQFRTQIFIQQMERFSKGIADFRKRLYWNEFKRLKVIVPPLEEQQQITEYIEYINSKIDTAISCKMREIEKLKEYKTVLIDSAVTGKIKVCGD